MGVPILNVWNEETQRYEPVPAIKGDKPVRGIDYWTDEDKSEMKSYIDSQLGVIENGTY